MRNFDRDRNLVHFDEQAEDEKWRWKTEDMTSDIVPR